MLYGNLNLYNIGVRVYTILYRQSYIPYTIYNMLYTISYVPCLLLLYSIPTLLFNIWNCYRAPPKLPVRRILVGGRRCRQQQASLRKKCYHSCYTYLVRWSKRFSYFVVNLGCDDGFFFFEIEF